MKASEFGQNAGLKRLFLFPCGMLLVLLLTSFYPNTTPHPTEKPNDDKFTVVLDAGHGGHDPGNLGNGYKEKNIALNIVLNAGALLEKNPDIKVIYTRKDDTFVDLYVRGEIANKAGADLFVSVHCDSHTSKANGAGTFVLGLHANKQNFEIAKKENSVIYLEDDYKSRYADYDINSPESVIGLTIMQEEFLDQSIALAKAIQDNFSDKLNRNNRMVKQAGFIVLHQTFMPSVLVETGFLTNKEEGAYLNSKKGQSQMGTAIAEAVLTYKEDARANMADFSPGAIRAAPEPDDKAEKSRKNKDNDQSSSEKPKASKEKKASRASRKEAAEIIAEADRKAKETERAAVEKREAAKKEADMKEAAKKEAAKKETDRRVAANREAAKKEAGKREADKKEADKIAIDKRAADKRAAELKEASAAAARQKSEIAETQKAVVTEKKKPNTNSEDIIYKVQIMAIVKDLPLRPESFNGLGKVAKEPIRNLYRYVYGSTGSLEEAKMLKTNADMKGYKTSFIAVYRNGERVSFREGKKYIFGQ